MAKTKEPKKPHGRPSAFTQEKADEICARMAKGEPLAQICRDEHMPGYRTVYDWQEAHEEFSANIAHARLDGYDAIAAECLLIANTPIEGVETTIKDGGKIEEKRGDMLGHRKLQIETRLKLLAKWDPRRYGERLELEGSGGGPLTVVVKDWTGRKQETEDGNG